MSAQHLRPKAKQPEKGKGSQLKMLDRSRDPGPLPKLYSIFRGEVASLQPYGAFVKIPHTRTNGLVHKTQISKMKIDNPSDVLTVGDMVYCKVISLGEAGEEKISLSMKVVNQDSGKDLDENLIITKQEELRRKKGLPPVLDKIELGAVLNTTCKKCGMKGHLTQDCFKLPGDKSYELIPELDLESLNQPPVQREKEKKKKSKHKKKREQNITSSSEENTSNEEEGTSTQSRHQKRKKKRKKHKKEKLGETSSDNSLEKEQEKKVKRKDSKRTFVKKDDSSPSYKKRTNSSDEEDYRESTRKKKRKKSHDDKTTEVWLKENRGDKRYHHQRTDHSSEHYQRHSKSSKCEKEGHSNRHGRR